MKKRVYPRILPALLQLGAASLLLAQSVQPLTAREPLTGYQLHVGDSVEVLYRTTPEYNQTVTVLPSGDVTLQLLGNVHLAGLTVRQAHDAIVALASRRLRDPEVSLSMKDFEKNHFVVLGEVTNPGKFELHGDVTAVEAIAAAGGFRSTSSQNNVVLVHRLDAEYGYATSIDYRRLRKKNASTEMPLLQNGDVLVVSTSKLAKLERVVKISSVGLYYPLP